MSLGVYITLHVSIVPWSQKFMVTNCISEKIIEKRLATVNVYSSANFSSFSSTLYAFFSASIHGPFLYCLAFLHSSELAALSA